MLKQLRRSLCRFWKWLDISPALYAVFGFCCVYWVYLVFYTEMYVVYDASSYEYTGRMLHEKGWVEFFKTGPQREPLYPWLVSVSMHLADIFLSSYQTVLRFLQVGLLFSTQFLLLIVLRQIKIRKPIVLLTILYCGISPALVNATFSLFSEISTIPFALLSLICVIQSWHVLMRKPMCQVIVMALLTAGAFLVSILSKGVFVGVFLIHLIIIFVMSCAASIKQGRYYWPRAIVYAVLSLMCVSSFMLGYMSLNKKYNGSFQYTNRVSNAIFGAAYKRSQKVTSEIFWAHVASIPGKGVCRRFFSEEECVYCEAYSADYFSGMILPGKLSGVPVDDRGAKVVQLTMDLIKKNVGQYIMFMGYEAVRMPFWESTQVGFVKYPPWLDNLFSWGLFKDGIRLLVSILTFCALIFMVFRLPRYYRASLEVEENHDDQKVCFFVVFFALTYTAFFTITFVLTRYALPIVPLYLVMIAYGMNELCGFNKQEDRS